MDVRGRVVAAAYVALRVIDRLLQVVVPPRDDRVCFLSIPDHTDNAYYAYRHLVKTRTGLEIVWLVGDLGVADQIHREFSALVATRPDHGHRLRVEPRHSLRGYLVHLRSRWTFHSHGAYAFSRWAFRRDVVNLWHGMPIKAIGRLNTVSASRKQGFGSLHVATSAPYRYVIACAFGVPASRVVVSGLPRCDALRFADARSHTRDEVRDRLEIPHGRRLVLWMPTYRVQEDAPFVHAASRLERRRGAQRSFLDDLPDWALPALADACAAHDCTLVIKPHPFDVVNHRPVDLGLDEVRFLTSPDFLATGLQLYDLLAATDGLVSDLSSVIIDYLVTGRPIGLIGFDPDTYDRDLVLPMELFSASRRLHALADPTDVDAFLRDVQEGRSFLDTTDELSALVHEDVDGPSAEHVLAEVGL